jgi:hypothetical protein
MVDTLLTVVSNFTTNGRHISGRKLYIDGRKLCIVSRKLPPLTLSSPTGRNLMDNTPWPLTIIKHATHEDLTLTLVNLTLAVGNMITVVS